MARSVRNNGKTPKAAETTAVVSWDQELAKFAEEAAQQEANAGGGQFFSTRNGILSWQDVPVKNNEMVVVILAAVFENVFFEGSYDPDSPQAPTCFAFAESEGDLAPHENVVEAKQAQHDSCKGCPNNEWGSADVGRGKACRNTRRLAMVPAGDVDKNGNFELADDPNHYATTTVGFLKLPVTSVKGYANFVKQVAGALSRPLFAVAAKVSVSPDPKTQFRVNFEVVEALPDEVLPAVLARRKEVAAIIDFPYELMADEPPAPKNPQRGGVKRSRKY